MIKEFNLSEKILEDYPDNAEDVRPVENLRIEDVKEFIKILKEEIKNYAIESDVFNLKAHRDVQNIINKLAGDKLI